MLRYPDITLALLLLTALAPAAHGASCQPTAAGDDRHAVFAGDSEQPWASPLLDALTRSPPEIAPLQKALVAVPDAQRNDPLVARAQLTIAALLLQAGHPDAARESLRQIATDTAVALDAGLLMAETHAADPPTALQWNLRIARRWPQEPDALAALAERAWLLSDTDRALAGSALREAQQHAVAAIHALTMLGTQLQASNWYAQWLADGTPPALNEQLLQVFYRTVASSKFTDVRAIALATARPALCARQQQARLIALHEDIERTAQEASHALAELAARHAALQAQFDASKSRWLAAAHDGTPMAMATGQQVTRLGNAVARDTADIAALRSTLDGLPAARARLEARARQLRDISLQINQQAGDEVLTALRDTLDVRITRLRDVAGTAAQRQGELQDPRYRRAR